MSSSDTFHLTCCVGLRRCSDITSLAASCPLTSQLVLACLQCAFPFNTMCSSTTGTTASCPSQACLDCNVLCRSTEISQIHHTLHEVALPTHIWRRHGLPGRPDGGKASLADMLHKPNTILEQVRHFKTIDSAASDALNESNMDYGCAGVLCDYPHMAGRTSSALLLT